MLGSAPGGYTRTSIWQSESFCCSNGVGDFSFPGSEYQVLHLDVSPATKIETDAATGQRAARGAGGAQ